ncbi:MAG: hypothetical protein FK734_00060 [Asgard group archaeon]|nr:hypothetical protein [Asgard group archaeon]
MSKEMKKEIQEEIKDYKRNYIWYSILGPILSVAFIASIYFAIQKFREGDIQLGIVFTVIIIVTIVIASSISIRDRITRVKAKHYKIDKEKKKAADTIVNQTVIDSNIIESILDDFRAGYDVFYIANTHELSPEKVSEIIMKYGNSEEYKRHMEKRNV